MLDDAGHKILKIRTRKPSVPIRAVIFDADDTLWECGEYYIDRWDRYIDGEVERTGLDREFIASIFFFFDGKLVELPDGFTRDRFPRTFYVTSMALDAILGDEPDLGAASRAYRLGDSVYDAEYAMYPNVREMLEKMKADYPDVQRIALTKGSYNEQLAKFEKNDLSHLFDSIYIRSVKNETEFQLVLMENRLMSAEVLVVGDSMKDDIIVPKNIGCRTVWTSTTKLEDWKPSWIYEDGTTPIPPDWQIDSVADLLELDVPFTRFHD